MHIPECNHIKTDGIRCKSPALRGRALCYYHARSPRPRIRRPAAFILPTIDSHESFQLALTQLIAALANGQLEGRRASAILYALQLASNHLNSINL